MERPPHGTQMTLAIITLKNILPLHPKCKTIIYSIPMCHSKCHNVDTFSLEEVAYVDKWESCCHFISINLPIVNSPPYYDYDTYNTTVSGLRWDPRADKGSYVISALEYVGKVVSMSSLCTQINDIVDWIGPISWKISVVWHLRPKCHITKNMTFG